VAEFELPPELEKLLSTLEHPDILLTRVSKLLAEESIDLIKQGFRAQTDPYGRKWKPKQAADGRMTLSGPTSRLKGGWHRKEVTPGGFRIAPAVDYGIYHQSPGPASKLPQRMMIPDAEKGIPASWRRAYDEAALEVLRQAFSP